MAKQVVERLMSGSGGSGVSGALKLIGGAALLGIGISQSMYTSEWCVHARDDDDDDVTVMSYQQYRAVIVE